MRLLYITDTHIRGTSPRSRIDDFPETMRQKLAEVKEIADREQVDAILHGGDVFDRPNLSPAVVRGFVQQFRDFSVPIYAIAGNHDIYGHNPETIDRTMLGLLDAFGTIRLIRNGEMITLEKDGVLVQLTGQSFHYDLDKRDCALDYCVKNQIGATYCIHMVHGMLVDRPFPDHVAHTLVQHLFEQENQVDILLTGHYHAGFPIQERKGKYIVNPGALARINSSHLEIQRMPQVALIDLTDGIQIRLIPLSCAAKGETVIDRSYIEQANDRQQKLAAFVQEVEAANEFKAMDVREIIDTIALLEGVAEEVKFEAMRRISIAEQDEGEADL
ncbi:metallophosphoesterase family protein [Thermoflavimicrobium dichotomicum]|uniref:DNA repair exonuclease SbcCD nuclease subunit n=1 Tax=Thermoflavimicrobium dichotomicum TaxID=46223 RepID=A0A1I3PU39_9BACL|nr:metallophosphoesterase [Thermoflavimicrobium dichotomicum]SFJ24940.1 DNA repair exonuclease SbcCD nuclease subunit [Thermoflavimicrobium dichotomicum]